MKIQLYHFETRAQFIVFIWFKQLNCSNKLLLLTGEKVQILAVQTGVTAGAMLNSDKCQVRLVVKGNVSIFAGRWKDNKVVKRKCF